MAKPYIQSQTIQGAIKVFIPVAVMLLQLFGVNIMPEEVNSFTDAIAGIIVGVSGIWGIVDVVIGRRKAEVQLSGIFTVKE